MSVKNQILEVAYPAQLLFNFPQEERRKESKPPADPAIVDGTALIDHHLAFLVIARNPFGKNHTKCVAPDEPRGAGNNPGRGVTCFIEQIGLDDENGPHFPRFRSKARIQIGQIEAAVFYLHVELSPSPAR